MQELFATSNFTLRYLLASPGLGPGVGDATHSVDGDPAEPKGHTFWFINPGDASNLSQVYIEALCQLVLLFGGGGSFQMHLFQNGTVKGVKLEQ